jgi:putative sporulation protein YyaC
MGFFSNIPWNKILKKEYLGHSAYSYIEEESTTKKFIIEKDETLYNGTAFFHELIKDNLNNLVVVCVGTDKWIFDSLAPFVGSILESKGFSFPIYGTIESPIHALNLEDSLIKIKNNHPDGFFIGIDACCGDEESQFEIHLRDYPIHPGAGINKKLPNVGYVSIVGVIAISDSDNKLHEIRLRDVICMANKISDIIMESVESYKSNDLRKDNILNFMNYRNRDCLK